MTNADVIVIGAGLAGLVAAAEAADAGRTVIVLDQEPQSCLGGQAYWSFGGLFLVDSPAQRRLGIKDSAELALADWLGSAGFDRPEDHWPRQWAHAYVDFAAGEKLSWLKQQGVGLFPIVQWAERGGYQAGGHGNSVPRFHVTWGTGPGLLTPFVRRVMEHAKSGRISLRFRHQVTELITHDGAVTGVAGSVLEPSPVDRGVPSSRRAVAAFQLEAGAVIVTSGGIGANHDLVRANWPAGFGEPPVRMLSGVPDSTDGKMLAITEQAGGRVINRDRMWHYPEGIVNHSPVWTGHGIRILSGPSPLWLDANGRRLPSPLFPGFDALGALRHITGDRPPAFLVPAQPGDHRARVRAVRVGAERGPDRQVGVAADEVPAGRRTDPGSTRLPGPRGRLPDRANAGRTGQQDERAGRRGPGVRVRPVGPGRASRRSGAVGAG